MKKIFLFFILNVFAFAITPINDAKFASSVKDGKAIVEFASAS